MFFTDFADYLETLVLSSERLVITVDFNVHVDDSNDPDATKLSDLLDVTQSTHELGHTTDLIITRQSDSIIHGSPTTLFSDHLTVLTTLRATKRAITSKQRVYRKMKSIDLGTFRKDLKVSELCQETPTRSLMTFLNARIRH